LFGVIRRAIINYDQLPSLKYLFLHTLNGFREETSTVVGRNNDGESWSQTEKIIAV
jgi:hypothetical protein